MTETVTHWPMSHTAIVDTSRSPARRLCALPFAAVRLGDGFWSLRRATNRSRALPYGYSQLVASGVISNFEIAAGRRQGGFRNMVFADSDLYKWLEAASYELANARDPELDRQVDDLVALVAAAQSPDGYLDTFYQLSKPHQRWTNLAQDHELYCAGHLFQAAVAHARSTGKRSLLAVARRFADHIASTFGADRLEGVPGHPEVEMALVELYRATGERRYLDAARYFVDARGRGLIGGSLYHQDHIPIREAVELAGHAVRQLYLLAGVVDVYLETGDDTLLRAAERLWDDMTTHKMSLTGGVGARHEGESFGESYELPNDRVYNETCAQIASVMWNWRLLLATGKPRYADLLEWTLYNGVLSGVSLDGTRYFYPNPLLSRGGVQRSEWFACACCPPNVMRTLASVHAYFATADGDALQIHLYDNASIEASLPAAGKVRLAIETRYPWEGSVRIVIEQTDEAPWTLALRVPGWSDGGEARCPDATVAASPGSYLSIHRRWRKGETVELELSMPVRMHEAHPWVEAARGCAALSRGPLVYCFEDCDQPTGVSVLDCSLELDGSLEPRHEPGILDGVVTVGAQGTVADRSDWAGVLYRTRGPLGSVPKRRIALKAIPYYAWANRTQGAMTVWMPIAPRA